MNGYAAGVNPLIHYIQFGWRESLPENPFGTNPNRDPNPLFDTSFYYETHTDVKDEILQDEEFFEAATNYSSANALQHYIEFGDEGKFAVEERITFSIYEAENQFAFSSFIDAESEGFEFAQRAFRDIGYELTAGEQGEILVASPTLLLNPVVISGIKYTIFLGGTYIAADQLDVPEGVLTLYESITQTTLYESLSIALDNLSTGTPPFPGDVIESTIQVETFPKGNTVENLLDLDSRFYTPLDPIDELAENVESFPQRDEILDGLLNEPFIFPDVVEIPQQIYLIDGGSANPFPIGSSSSMGIQEVDDFISTIAPRRTPTNSSANLFEIEQTGLLNYRILTGQINDQGRAETFDIDGFRGRTILDTKYIGNPTRSPYINNSQAPQFLKDNVLRQERDQFRRTADIINNPSIPFTQLEVLVNDAQAVEYFESLLEEFNIPGQVRIVPTVVQ
ncbi:MAG: hypothetical protein AAGF83_27850 [Cyanobacteria bacterium P01_G01_bin.67]